MNFHFTRINNFLKNCKKITNCLFENWPKRRFLNAYFIVYNVISWKLFAKFAEDRWRRPDRLRCSGKFWRKIYRRYSILFQPFLEPLGAELGANSFRSVTNYETETTTLCREENWLAWMFRSNLWKICKNLVKYEINVRILLEAWLIWKFNVHS